MFGATSLIGKTFEYRSGRTLAASRLILIALFAIALWIDPVQPLRVPPPIVNGLLLYWALALALLLIAWRNWWLDHALAAPAFAADALAYFAAMSLTQGMKDDFFSPFIVFYAFMLISASIRWGWRFTLILGLALSLGFGMIGLLITETGIDLDTLRIGRRAIYMMTLAAAVAWFVAQYADRSHRARVPFPVSQAREVLDEGLAWAMACTGASGGAIAWADSEEPRVQMRCRSGTTVKAAALAPDELDLERPGHPALFDASKDRALWLVANGTKAALGKGARPDLAGLCSAVEGLVVPLRGATGNGQLVLCGITGMSVDHLRLATALGQECTLAADRAQLASVHEQASLVRMRNAVARDLHDSVAQSLAGASFRLAALAEAIAASGGGTPDAITLIGEVQSSIAAEQGHVRDMIERLRHDEFNSGLLDLSTELAALAAQQARHWNISIRPEVEADVFVPAMVGFEIQHLVREAVANAVRHGRASRIDLVLERGRNGIMLMIADDGVGFTSEAARPRSLAERVEALGGTLVISTQPDDTRLVITLPTGQQ